MGRTKQAQRMRTARTTTKTAITQKQSLEAIQTLIHGGLSSLTYIRCLFAEKAYDCRFYQMGSITPYDEYAEGKIPTNAAKAEKPFTRMQVLRRDRSKRVDTFLDWLEQAAFPLLADGRLRAIQIYVHQDEHDRDKVIETWTFTVRYHSLAPGIKSPVAIEVNGGEKSAASVGEANTNLQNVLKAIQDLCHTLPALPVERFVSTQLFYCSDDEVSLKDFTPATSTSVLFAHAEGWEKHVSNVETLCSNFHSAGFKVSHLAIPAYDRAQDLSELYIPTKLEYSNVTARMAELDLLENDETARVIQNSQASEMATRAKTSSMREREGITTTTPPSRVKPDLRPPRNGKTSTATNGAAPARGTGLKLHDSLDTQSSHVPRMRKALHQMMHPENLTQGETQAQPVMRSVPPTPPQVNREATPTTASGLDFRASLPPYQTPMYPQSYQAKRTREEDDVFSSPANSSPTSALFKRLKSCQSLVVLNANGMSSSPAPVHGTY